MQSQSKVGKSFNLRRSPVSRACVTVAMMVAAPGVFAAAGFGDSNGPDGSATRPQTYYAHTPTGKRIAVPTGPNARPAVSTEAAALMGSTYDGNTGAALHKFIDPLPLVGVPQTLFDGITSKYIPAAVPVKWVKPDGTSSTVVGGYVGDDYYEIAVVEYKEKMHSDLKNATTVRGYVQIDQFATNGLTAPSGWISKAVSLKYPNGSAIMVPKTDANGQLLKTATGALIMTQAKAVDNPHYLGPAIVATRNVAARVKFHNLLPVGRYNASTGRNGDLFIPVDETLAGAGVGPDGVTRYTQNRAELHLHGGDTPWISDGTPHQWIAPAGERPLLAAEMAAAGSPLSVDTFMRGPSAQNVPDMNEPGEGAVTYYFPNRQSARLEWYHDHSYGLTRLNAYAGEAAPYVVSEPAQDAMLASGVAGFPSDTIYLVVQDKTFVPEDIKLQDGRWNARVNAAGKNVPFGSTEKPLWGEASDLWYPHVYEVNQDPSNGLDGTNPVGRWDWGPYFWPVFPSLYNLPTGAVEDVTLTPEAWMDTPVINGVAYPTLTVEPRAQRFKILNGANDRFWNLSFFVADSAVSEFQMLAPGSGYQQATTTVSFVSQTDGLGNAVGTGATAEAIVNDATGEVTGVRITNPGTGYSKAIPPLVSIDSPTGDGMVDFKLVIADNTEVKMVPAVPVDATSLPACDVDANGVDIAPPYAAVACLPSYWPTDGRDGGVPDPTTAGPKIYQIGTEGGLLPKVAEIAAAPMQYEYNRRSITVLNTFQHSLFLGNAERADILVDFTPYAGKTLIMYSDAPAPVPAFDPRNDHWTGKPDETTAGSVDTPMAGFGPNTRTLMQIKVAATTAAGTTGPALDPVALKTRLPQVYGDPLVGQETPVVAQSHYAAAFGKTEDGALPAGPNNWPDAPQVDGTKAFATIFTGSLQEPTFRFTPGTPNGGFDKLVLTSRGSGYMTPPVPVIDAPTGANPVQATATTTLRVETVNVTNGGRGFKFSPVVTFGNTSAGSGAMAVAKMKVAAFGANAITVTGTARGAGYTAAQSGVPGVVTFSAPDSRVANARRATGTATITSGRVTGINVTDQGFGYTSSALVSIAPPAALTGTKTQATVAPADLSIASIDLVSTDPNHPEFAGGAGYDNMANVTVNITAPTGANAVAATATVTGSVSDITLANAGHGYTTTPNVTFPVEPNCTAVLPCTAAAAVGQAGGSSILVKNKAIQELFDPTYGRMNATLGVEIPFTSALTQTTIPLGYVDPVTEQFEDGETQIWKITHNGVDSHPVHFHLLNVQLINRVGWDGTIKPPMDNEYGWKETIRMNPLEDILVAVRAKKPVLPGFGLPLSQRLRDPSQPAGVPMGFTQVDVVTGMPAVVTNQVDNFGWEYVWHCHILGHEENDFMRPVKFNANEVIPATPTNLANPSTGKLTWMDMASTEYKYMVYTIGAGTNSGASFATTLVQTLPANSTQALNVPVAANYAVVAEGAAGSAGAFMTPTVIAAPTSLQFNRRSGGRLDLTFVDSANNETGFLVELSADNGATWTISNTGTRATGTGLSRTVTVNGLTTGVTYQVRVFALGASIALPGGKTLSIKSNALTGNLVY